MVPGRKRPSSTEVEETLTCEADPVATPMTSVSADVASRRAAHQEQKFPPVLPRPQEGHFTVAVMDSPILAAPRGRTQPGSSLRKAWRRVSRCRYTALLENDRLLRNRMSTQIERYLTMSETFPCPSWTF